MLKLPELKIYLHQNLKRRDKMLVTLAGVDTPATVAMLRERASEAGLRTSGWNISSLLSGSNGLAIRVREGWELSEKGRVHLSSIGINLRSTVVANVTSDLRSHLQSIQDPITRQFAEEAISCYEAGLHRSAIVMSWIAAVDLLHKTVHRSHLASFNVEAQRRNSKWKAAVSTDDLGLMSEREFLDVIVSISLIGKNVKAQLVQALDLRNGCGHPNSLSIGENIVAAHLEKLLFNVFKPFG